MKGAWTIYRREVAGLFFTPLAWVLLCLALLFHGFYFSYYLSGTGGDVNLALSLSLGGGFDFWILLMILPPLLTMRMISEEAESGMLEFLLTAPVSDAGLVVGKALAATTVMTLLWSSSVVFAAVLAWQGGQPDWGQVVGGLLGAVLVSALFCSLGLVASAMSSVALLAAFLAFVFNLLAVALPVVQSQFQGSLREVAAEFVRRVNVIDHLQRSFSAGAFDSADAVFFLSWIGVFLFLAIRLVESRRWR